LIWSADALKPYDLQIQPAPTFPRPKMAVPRAVRGSCAVDPN
jgi:hypothetical protein